MSSITLYHEDLDLEHLLFQWPGRNKTQHRYQNFFKELNNDHSFLQCSYFQDNSFEVIHTDIPLDKIPLVCAKTYLDKNPLVIKNILLPT